MQQVSREEAIRKFGATYGTGLRFPPYDFETYNYKNAAALEENRAGRPLRLKEILGATQLPEGARKGDWPAFIDKLMADGQKMSGEEVAKAVSDHCIAAYDRKRQEMIEAEAAAAESGGKQGFFSRIGFNKASGAQAMPTGQEIYGGLTAEIDYLPDVIKLPDRVLDVGTPFYKVVDNLDGGTSLVEFTVMGRSFQRMGEQNRLISNEKMEETIRRQLGLKNDAEVGETMFVVRYHAENQRGTSVHFCVDDKERPFYVGGRLIGVTYADNTFFLSKEKAEAYQTEKWLRACASAPECVAQGADAELKEIVQLARQRTLTPS